MTKHIMRQFIAIYFILKKRNFESQIKEYSGNDPIEIWHSYIEYLKQMSQKERSRTGVSLCTVYQKCLQKCQSFNYYDNEKYINILIEYVSENFRLKNSLILYFSDLFQYLRAKHTRRSQLIGLNGLSSEDMVSRLLTFS